KRYFIEDRYLYLLMLHIKLIQHVALCICGKEQINRLLTEIILLELAKEGFHILKRFLKLIDIQAITEAEKL
ncbi:hypothetical protein, partial [Flavonifractor plautii]|uniref:hypothetical protein n=1 Tax=Flavonifractor plautii TaxID=292800 RepID=UPI001D065883